MSELSDVSLEFEFVGQGWANCMLSVGDQSMQIEGFSDTHDETFREFLLAAINERVGGWSSHVVFDHEPTMHRLSLQGVWDHKMAQRHTELVVEKFPDVYGKSVPGTGKTVFEAKARYESFCEAVDSAFDKFDTNPADSFEPHWYFPYPIQARNALTAVMTTEARPMRPQKPGGIAIKIVGQTPDD